MAYEQLAIEMTAHDGGHLELIEFESATGQEYQLVIDCCYDDMPGGAIRVDGTVIETPMRPLLGFLPVYLSKACDGFILTPEGIFLDEDSDVAETDQAEQAGAGQPATRPVVEPEGGDKPQP